MESGSSNSQKLRQKAISLLYLLFIALVFIYVPSDFLDSINATNKSFEKTSKELSKLKANKFAMFEKIGAELDISAMRDSVKYKLISQLSDTLFDQIENIKTYLIQETGGYNQYGYLAKSKEFDITDHLMLNTNKANNLRKDIQEFKVKLRPHLEESQKAILDSMLTIEEEIISSKGKLIKWEKFFFKKSPLSVSQMMLSKFQAEVRLIEYLVLDKYEQKFLQEVIVESGLSKAHPVASNKKQKLILKKARAIYNVGEEIVLDTELSDEEKLDPKKLIATYEAAGVKKDAEITDKGEIKFTPEYSGNYKIQTNYENAEFLETEISVMNPKPVISREELEILYLGIRNPLKIDVENIDPSKLKVTSDNGLIKRIGDLYYIKFDKPGEALVTVEAEIGNEKVHVNSRKFKVKDLPLPYATLNSLRSGEVLEANLRTQRKLLIKSEKYDTENFYNVRQFRLTRISGDGYEVNQLPSVNRTANFGSSTLEMVKKANKGDLFVFDEIIVVGANGKQYELQALAFNVI